MNIFQIGILAVLSFFLLVGLGTLLLKKGSFSFSTGRIAIATTVGIGSLILIWWLFFKTGEVPDADREKLPTPESLSSGSWFQTEWIASNWMWIVFLILLVALFLSQGKKTSELLGNLPIGKLAVGGLIAYAIFFPAHFKAQFEEVAGTVRYAILSLWPTDGAITVSSSGTPLQVILKPGEWSLPYRVEEGLRLHYIGDTPQTGTFKEKCLARYWSNGVATCNLYRFLGTGYADGRTVLYLAAKP